MRASGIRKVLGGSRVCSLISLGITLSQCSFQLPRCMTASTLCRKSHEYPRSSAACEDWTAKRRTQSLASSVALENSHPCLPSDTCSWAHGYLTAHTGVPLQHTH